MSLTIVVSGPRVSEQQARNALAADQFEIQTHSHEHGMTPTVTGEDIAESQAFVTCIGDDQDKAADAVRSLGWVLRMSFENSQPVEQPQTPEDDLRSEVATLRTRLADLEAKVS